ncbi:unnamed protein product, partial [Ectocarpus sp. 8 AP-2014]
HIHCTKAANNIIREWDGTAPTDNASSPAAEKRMKHHQQCLVGHFTLAGCVDIRAVFGLLPTRLQLRKPSSDIYIDCAPDATRRPKTRKPPFLFHHNPCCAEDV